MVAAVVEVAPLGRDQIDMMSLADPDSHMGQPGSKRKKTMIELVAEAAVEDTSPGLFVSALGRTEKRAATGLEEVEGMSIENEQGAVLDDIEMEGQGCNPAATDQTVVAPAAANSSRRRKS